MNKPNQIIAIGDLHGNWNIIKDFLNSTKMKNVTLIQVGDFGVGFREKQEYIVRLQELNEFLCEKGVKLLVLRGSHDNPLFFKDDSIIFTNIFFVRDHSLIDIGGKNVYFIGGAISIDRELITEEEDYWKGEAIDKKPIEEIKDKVGKADIIITHQAPIFAYPTLREIPSDRHLTKEIFEERYYLYEVSKCIDKDCIWVYGRYHKSNVNHLTINEKNVKFILLGIEEFRLID